MIVNSIINNDCFNILSEIEDESIDLIATDPPYEIDYNNEVWDKKQLNFNLLFNHYLRILKRTGNLIIFQGWSNVCETISIGKKYFTLNDWIIYDRIKGRGAKRKLLSTREDILWFVKSNDYIYNKIYSKIPKKTKGMGSKNGELNRALSNVWTDISPIVPWSKEKVNHPIQKPLALMERIVTIFSNENDLVLDSFAGSGSTLVAAKILNRNYIGIEKNIDYCDICKNRLL